MISEKLQKAREFEQEQLSKISPEERPSFHVTGGTGWINDPNGFSYYNGEYHLFYQYNPYSNEWGPMHWGHLSSKDMLAWKRLPVVMAPEESYDNFGCFSGSALELSDGRHLLMYTGVGFVGDTPMANGELPTHQTQCIAVGDGINYEKYENNPVITGDDIPEGGSKVDFRDPKIWKEDDGYFYAVISNMTDDGNSRILLYKSPDAFKWEYVTVLDHSDARLGKMWECPDFFQLGSKRVLICSPQDMKAQKYEFHNGHNSVYFLGDYDEKTHTFVKELPHALDYGMDIYAPQTTELPDGRRIMIAWMKSWDACVIPNSQDWQGMMTLPREL